MEQTKHIDFLAIGDMVTDAFIELLDAKVTCDINEANCTISMRFGDKIPYKDVTVMNAVGNSPNAATSAKRLGLQSAIMCHIGDDTVGNDCLAALAQEMCRPNTALLRGGPVERAQR
jgi:sugar/nucleoside kinase (ribokinase family)